MKYNPTLSPPFWGWWKDIQHEAQWHHNTKIQYLSSNDSLLSSLKYKRTYIKWCHGVPSLFPLLCLFPLPCSYALIPNGDSKKSNHYQLPGVALDIWFCSCGGGNGGKSKEAILDCQRECDDMWWVQLCCFASLLFVTTHRSVDIAGEWSAPHRHVFQIIGANAVLCQHFYILSQECGWNLLKIYHSLLPS